MGWSTKKKIIVSCTSGWALVLFGAILIPVADILVKDEVKKKTALVEGNVLYEVWRDLPLPIYMQFYIFDCVNPNEVLMGGKPYVIQKGPYTYRENRIKFDIKHNDNGTVTYRQNKTFTFIPEMSDGNETDVFTTPNPVFWSLISALKWQIPAIQTAINVLTSLQKESVFMKRTMKEIVWGYHDPMLTLANRLYSPWFYTDYIGYFMNKNNTNDGVYTIFTGENDYRKTGVIDKYNGSSYLDFWNTQWANQINGTDGILGPPYLDKTMRMPSFQSDVCRSIQGVFSEDVESPHGFKLWRFVAPMDYVENATLYPDNEGFCTPNCLDTGMLNISTCQMVDFFHIPVALSFPHFYLAAEQYQKSVDGLSPNKEEHQVALDLEPYTGWVLQAAKRLQINLYMQPIHNIAATSDLTPVFMPVLWLNESAVIDDKNAALLKSMLFTPLMVIKVAEIALMSCGALILVATVIYGVQCQRSKTVNISGKSVLNITPSLAGSTASEERQPIITYDNCHENSYTSS